MTSTRIRPGPVAASPRGTALRTAAVVCSVAGLVLMGVATGMTAYTESICHELYGRSIQEIPVGQWPPSTLIYLSVGALGALTTLVGLVCTGLVLIRRRRS